MTVIKIMKMKMTVVAVVVLSTVVRLSLQPMLQLSAGSGISSILVMIQHCIDESLEQEAFHLFKPKGHLAAFKSHLQSLS